MVMASMMILFAMRDLWRLDILVWIIGLPVLLLALMWLLYQLRQNRQMKFEQSLLAGMQRHSVEYDLVLKVMKLAIWRIDVATRTFTFESDFRDTMGSFHFPPNTPLDAFYDMVLPEYRHALRRTLEEMMEGKLDESHEQYKTRLPHSDQIHWEEAYCAVEKRGADGQALVIVGTLSLIDNQKELEESLIEARNHAEESDRLKSAFLANMSHEIRTPLNAVVGFGDVLPMAQSDEERNELVHLIKQNTTHLLRLFDDMAVVSKLEAGGDMVKMTRFDLNQLLTEVADKFAERSQQTGVKIAVEALANSIQPTTDRDRLFEILNQYMDNAMKFTDKGVVTLGYQVANNHLRVWVRDTGKGIPASHCNEHLFERFVKVDEFVPGTGLGLSICRSLALGIGGKVGVESKVGVGSLFWVEIAL